MDKKEKEDKEGVQSHEQMVRQGDERSRGAVNSWSQVTRETELDGVTVESDGLQQVSRLDKPTEFFSLGYNYAFDKI